MTKWAPSGLMAASPRDVDERYGGRAETSFEGQQESGVARVISSEPRAVTADARIGRQGRRLRVWIDASKVFSGHGALACEQPQLAGRVSEVARAREPGHKHACFRESAGVDAVDCTRGGQRHIQGAAHDDHRLGACFASDRLQDVSAQAEDDDLVVEGAGHEYLGCGRIDHDTAEAGQPQVDRTRGLRGRRWSHSGAGHQGRQG